MLFHLSLSVNNNKKLPTRNNLIKKISEEKGNILGE
jgi:hypothetical protein